MNKQNLAQNLKQKNQHKKSIKISLNNYIEQLKIHFNISDNDINDIMKEILKSRQNNWWQIW